MFQKYLLDEGGDFIYNFIVEQMFEKHGKGIEVMSRNEHAVLQVESLDFDRVSDGFDDIVIPLRNKEAYVIIKKDPRGVAYLDEVIRNGWRTTLVDKKTTAEILEIIKRSTY